MKYLKSEPFSCSHGDRQAQKNYSDNYEQTFGKKDSKPEPKKQVKPDEAIANRRG